jgi:hypothetical protein
MWRVALISPLLFSLTGCASFPPDGNLTQALRDCTEQFGGWAGKPALAMPVAERELVLNSATQWAVREEYFPCNVTVCGAVVLRMRFPSFSLATAIFSIRQRPSPSTGQASSSKGRSTTSLGAPAAFTVQPQASAPNYVFKPTAGETLQSFRLLPAGSGLTRR